MTTRSAVYTSLLLSLYNLYIHELYKRLGLYYNVLYKELLRRLCDLYTNLGMWDEIKGRNKGWFKHMASNLESGWRFPIASSGKPRIANPSLIQSLTFAQLYKRCFGQDPDPGIRDLDQQLDRDRSIILLGLFGWLSEDFDRNHTRGLWDLIIEEFNMYD
jgi:hypothetical protein